MAMAKHLLVPVLILLLLAPSLRGWTRTPGNSQVSTFSVSVDLVKIPVSVFDSNGAMIQDLHMADFTIFEEGVRQEVHRFGLDTNPVSVVLVIDTSTTVEKELKKIKEAAEKFARALSPEDRIAVISFADQVVPVLDWTNDIKQVQRALKRLKTGVRTALYDAMFAAASKQLQGVEGRKAIILLTDGLNNQSNKNFREASVAIIQSQASLYVISKTVLVRNAARTQRRVVMLSDIYRRMFGDHDYISEFFEKIEARMTDLAERSGGRCLFLSDYNRIPGLYSEVALELKSKYYLTYISNRQKAPDTFHRINVEYKRPHGKISYRRGYYFRPQVGGTSRSP